MICNEIFRYLTEFHESSWRGERLIWTKEDALKLKTVSGVSKRKRERARRSSAARRCVIQRLFQIVCFSLHRD